jgi:cell envelope-related Asp23 family protein
VTAPPRPEARGRTDIGGRVVERIARQAVSELPRPGTGGSPRVKATIDGKLATLRLTVSVVYPEPVQRVTRQLREHVTARVGELTGLEVRQIDIDVARLVPPSEYRREVL